MSHKADVNSYSPDGRIYQIEYAMQSASHGTTVLAFEVGNTVIIISEKKIISPLHITLPKISIVYDHILFSFSGIASDARVITKIAREYCLNHEKIYNEKSSVEGLMRYLCRLSLKFSESEEHKKIFSRPFGASIICAGFDTDKNLFVLDPSGSYRKYEIKSIGGGSEAVEEELKNEFKVENVDDGILKGLEMIKKVIKDGIRKDNVEVAKVDEKGIWIASENEIDNYLNRIIL
ncbi:proteasome component pup2 [Gurleya vavrai]